MFIWLCQAAKSWYEIAFTFKRITHDGALWYKPYPAVFPVTTKDTHTTTTISQVDTVDGCYVLAYVDDCLVVGTADEVRVVKDFLGTKFKIKDLRDISVFTGLLIQHNRSRRTLQISQGYYARQLIDTYSMTCRIATWC